MDHTQQLGNTLGEIAFEKAGIIKSGIPVVSGVRHAEARETIRRVAAERNSPLWELDREIQLAERRSGTDRVWNVSTPLGNYGDFCLGLQGTHQGMNAALALAAVELFQAKRTPPDRNSIALSLSQISLPGRQEILSRTPLILLDSSHNVDSTSALVRTLAEEPFSQYRKIGIYGSSADKDIAGQFGLLRDFIDEWIVTRVEESPRSCPVETLLSLARSQMLECVRGEEHPELALKRAWGELDDATCLVVTGSFFLSGKLRTLILERFANENGQPVSNRLPESIY
jgi:dihydrofolate synthase/folylpolyglutamate synthase